MPENEKPLASTSGENQEHQTMTNYTSIPKEVKDAARKLTTPYLKQGYIPAGIYRYSGSYYRIRLDNPAPKDSQRSKLVYPLSKNGHGWALKEPEFPPSGKPLYRRDDVLKNPDATIWFVEGEPCADTLASFGFLVVTSGSASSADSADWTPLKGRNVIVWPDNDEQGQRYADAVESHLTRLGCHVERLDIAKLNLPEGGDCVDWLKAHPGVTQADIEGLSRMTVEVKAISEKMDISSAILDFVSLCKAEIPERKMILPWLPEGGLGMMYAPRGLGKTFFGISLAVSVASGERFMKWGITAPCGVLYVDGEMPLHSFRERLTGFTKKEPQHPLVTLSHETFYQRFAYDLSVTNNKIQSATLDFLDGNPNVRLVLVDNLSALAHIREDKSDDWRAEFLPFLIAMRRRGVAVVLIHHAGKSGDQRGTGAREDALDSVIKLSRADDEKTDGARFKVEFSKSRGAFGADVEPFIASLKTVDGFFEWDVSDIEQSVEKRLLALIESMDGITVCNAARELGVGHGAISKIKKKLLADSQIRMSGKEMALV